MTFDLGELHPALIHFPIALIFIALIFDILYWVKQQQVFQNIAAWMIIIAAVLLIPAAFTGFLAKDFYPVGDPDVIRHQYMALATAFFTLGYAIFRGYVLSKQKIIPVYLYLLLGLINIGLINTTAEFGGIVVRGKGILYDSLRPADSPLPYGQVKK